MTKLISHYVKLTFLVELEDTHWKCSMKQILSSQKATVYRFFHHKHQTRGLRSRRKLSNLSVTTIRQNLSIAMSHTTGHTPETELKRRGARYHCLALQYVAFSLFSLRCVGAALEHASRFSYTFSKTLRRYAYSTKSNSILLIYIVGNSIFPWPARLSLIYTPA